MAKRKRLEENRRDRISELPSHIRQHILSFLSTRDALRSSILSTTWRYDWLSLPCLDFGKAFFRQYWKCADIRKTVIETTSNDPAKASEFFSFLNQALIRPRPTVQKLVLYLPASGELNSSIASCINELTVCDLHLDISGPCRDSYHPPRCILTSISITKLSLYGLSLISKPADVIQLPSLRDLSLLRVIIDQKMVENLIANCPAVECMRFSSCKGFKLLKVVGLPKLKQLVEKFNSDLQRVEVDAPNLYSLEYQPYSSTATTELILSPSCLSITCLSLQFWEGAVDWVNLHRKQLLHLKELCVVGSCMTDALRHINLWDTSLETLYIYAGGSLAQFDITCCQNLADVKLSGHLSDHWLNRHLRLLAHLQVLCLICDVTPTHVNISSNSLKHLAILMDCPNLEHVEIDCPNLSEFTYWISSTTTSISLGAALAPRCVNFHFRNGATIGSLSYEQLTGLFKKLGHSKYLCLHADTLKNVIIPGELRQSNKSPLCQFENLRLLLRETLTTEDITACIDGLLWLCPEVKTICITDLALFPTLKSQSEIYIKLEYKVPKELGPKGCGCYDGLQIHCWRHSLNGFEIIKHYGVEDDGSLKRFFKNAMVHEQMDEPC